MRQRGFTLVEVLVAMAIFAVLAAGVYQVLSSMVDTQVRITEHASKLRTMQVSMRILAQDLEQVAMRDIRLPNEDREPAFAHDLNGYDLLFTTRSLTNPLLERRSNLQRVAYVLENSENANGEKTWWRYVWPVLDRRDSPQPIKQKMLTGIDEWHFEFLDSEGDWQRDWPDDKNDDKKRIRDLPVAIKVTIIASDKASYERQFQLGNVIHQQVEKLGE